MTTQPVSRVAASAVVLWRQLVNRDTYSQGYRYMKSKPIPCDGWDAPLEEGRWVPAADFAALVRDAGAGADLRALLVEARPHIEATCNDDECPDEALDAAIDLLRRIDARLDSLKGAS